MSQRRFVRRRVLNLLKIGEIFSTTFGGNGPHGPGIGEPHDEEDPPTGGIEPVAGIQTEDGRNIETESGIIIQAENQG